MTVSCHGVAGGASSSQSKCGSTTTHFGIARALSSSSGTRSASSSPVGAYGSAFASSHAIAPSIAFAYGSIRSFCGLKRLPAFGSYGPWTR